MTSEFRMDTFMQKEINKGKIVFYSKHYTIFEHFQIVRWSGIL